MAVSVATAAAAAAATSQKLSPLTTPPHDKPFCSSFSKTLLKPCHPVTHTRKVHWTGVSVASKSPISDVISDVSDDYDDKPREECGVVGIYGDPEASCLCYLALHAVQHPGQEGAGIVSVHDNVLKSITGVGLFSDIFNESKLSHLPDDMAIGHVRYSTAGVSMLKNIKPYVAGYRFGSVGVAYNGNLVNYQSLRV